LNVIKGLFVGLPLLSLLAVETIAQGVCVPRRLDVASIHGRAIRTSSKGEEPLDEVSLVLRKKASDGLVVATATTDSSGRFYLGKVRDGDYVLVAERALYIRFLFPVRVRRPRIPSVPQKEIIINLGADYNDSCGGGFAELRKIKT
jgi:hypothetical protein